MKSILGYTRTSLDTFDERPFCQVDSLVLSSIAYTFFPKEILPEGDWNGIHFADLLKAEYFEQMFHGIWNGKSCLELLIALACSPRFRDTLICGYTQKYDAASEKQFSAVTFRLTPETVPQSSLVGMLFETQEDYKVVKSRAFSLFQHDPASWVVNGNDFAYANHLNSGARHMDETLNTWILGLSPADRERFVDTLFELLNSTDVFSTEELVQNWSANLQILMQAARALDPESREFLQRTIRDLFTISLKTIPDRFRKK